MRRPKLWKCRRLSRRLLPKKRRRDGSIRVATAELIRWRIGASPVRAHRHARTLVLHWTLYNSRRMKEMRVLRIHGKVQGVGYRFFATRVARRMGLKGYITNERDGTVAAAVEGEKQNIDDWIEELKEGPRYAEVTKIDQETKEYTGRLGDFAVKF